jgi:hypothetical protein
MSHFVKKVDVLKQNWPTIANSQRSCFDADRRSVGVRCYTRAMLKVSESL